MNLTQDRKRLICSLVSCDSLDLESRQENDVETDILKEMLNVRGYDDAPRPSFLICIPVYSRRIADTRKRNDLLRHVLN